MPTISKPLVAGLLGCALLLAGCKKNGCDLDQLTKIEEALKTMDDSEMRLKLGLVGLSEACGKHLPGDVKHSLEAVSTLDPADVATILAGGLSEASSFSNAACSDFAAVLGKVSSVPREGKAKALYEQCSYEKLGLYTAAESEIAAKKNMAGVLIGPPMFKWLSDNGVETARARTLMRTIVGL